MKQFILVALGLCFHIHSATAATCTAVATRSWVVGFSIEASAQGPTCANAAVTLTLRKKSGEAIWTRAHIAAQLMNFSQEPVADSKAMTLKLKDWISGNGFMTSADKLKEGGEFPFTPAEGIDKADFAKYQKAKLPLFCYIQGMESGNCLAVEKGVVLELGIQSFPG